tara:strand:- start:282 stop:578 length:297 start_codon:yes stop_codon:yes gene_type:complete
MALANKKQEAIHSRSGDIKAAMKAKFDAGNHTTLEAYPAEAAMLYQLQQMQEDIDELRRYVISAELLLPNTMGDSLPTRDPGSAGQLWNSSGAVKVSG